MTRFSDGQARGATLMLKRAPFFLRVVQSPDGKFDALDQLEDVAAESERIFAYEMERFDGHAHINRGKNGSGFYPMCNYKSVVDQPGDTILRDNDQWSKWCHEQAQKRGLKHA